VSFTAFAATWSDVDGRYQGSAVCHGSGTEYTLTRVDLRDKLAERLLAGDTLICQDAERHIVDILWPSGEDVTIHSYEQVFNRAVWRHSKGKKTEIWDSRNLAAGLSIAAIGKGIRLPLWDKPSRLSLGEKADRLRWICDAHLEWECEPCYLTRQAEILYRFALSLQEWTASLGVKMKRTVGGNAVALWQHFDTGKPQRLQGKLIIEMARAAYHGGRCECFQVGDVTDIHTGDISRHYASIMLECPMPDLNGLTYVEHPKSLELRDLQGLVEATVTVPEMAIPVLPAIGPDEQLYFPTGRIHGTWVIAEFLAALERGVSVVSIDRIAYTRKVVYPFETFINVVLNMRAEWERKNNPLSFWAKMLPNGLYGRLGVREIQQYRTYHRSQRPLTAEQIDGKDVIWIGDMRFLISDYNVRMQSKIQNVLWAATITAYGRLRLLKHLELAGPSLVYCDTDSIFSTQPLQVGSGRPGELRDTGHYQRGTILGPKLYRLESGDTPDMVAARGIPRQLALEFLTRGKVELPSPYTLKVAVDQMRRPGQWSVAVKNHRNVILKRQPISPPIPGQVGYHSFTRPVVFGSDSSLTVESLDRERSAR
jgi:DNA polymerase type B, organellar and viral